jgi:hypothetical protein
MSNLKIGLFCCIIFFISPLLIFSAPFKPGSEPDGFRGIKWGTDISSLKELEYIQPKDEDIKKKSPNVGAWMNSLTKDKYYRIGDKLKIGEIELSSITYGSLKGKFYTVTIELKGHQSFDSMLNVCFKLYGQIGPVDTYDYLWNGNNTSIYLEYNPIIPSNQFLYIWSSKFEADQIKDVKNKLLQEKQNLIKKEQHQLNELKKDF